MECEPTLWGSRDEAPVGGADEDNVMFNYTCFFCVQYAYSIQYFAMVRGGSRSAVQTGPRP